MEVRNIKETEILETMKLSSLCFEYPFQNTKASEEELRLSLLNEPVEKLHRLVQSQLGVFDDNGELMACMAAIPFKFYFEGNSYTGNGIGNVCTYPHHRKKGAIRAMFIKMLEDSYKEGQVFTYLYPFSEAFYGQFGYHRISNSMRYEYRILGFPNTKYDGSFHLLNEKSKETLLPDFKVAYTKFAKNYNMMVERDDFDWGIVTDAKAYYNNNYAYLYKNKSGEPVGYAVFKRDGRSLRCRELVFDSFETLKAIFSFIRTYSADNDIFKFHAPISIHMESLCQDFSAYPAKMEVASNGMVRVINVKSALLAATYIGSGKITLAISDQYLCQNEGIYEISFKNGKATNVELIPCNDFTDKNYDVKMDVSLFSAAIVGNFNVSDFEYVNGIDIKIDHATLSQIFYKKKCFINNYF